MDRHPSIITAASSLLGICFLVITGLSLSKSNSRSYADEIAWVAAIALLTSLMLSYAAIKKRSSDGWAARISDCAFIFGVAALTLSTIIVGFTLG